MGDDEHQRERAIEIGEELDAALADENPVDWLRVRELAVELEQLAAGLIPPA